MTKISKIFNVAIIGIGANNNIMGSMSNKVMMY